MAATPTWDETTELEAPTWQNTRGIEDFKKETEEAARNAAADLRSASRFDLGANLSQVAGDTVSMKPLRQAFNYVQGLGKQAADSALGYGEAGDLARALRGEPVKGALRTDTPLIKEVPSATPEDFEATYGVPRGAAEVMSGLSQGAAELVNFAQTLEGVALSRGGKASPRVKAVAAPAITTEIVNQAPHIIQEFQDAKARGDKAGMAKAAVNALVTVGGAAAVTKMGAPEVKPVPAIPETPLRSHADTIRQMQANEQLARQQDAGSPFVSRTVPVEPVVPGLPLERTSGLEMLPPEIARTPQAAPTIAPNTAMQQMVTRPFAEVGPPAPAISPVQGTGMAAQRLREIAAEKARVADFQKAAAEKVVQDVAEQIHPDKPLTPNQLKLVQESLTRALTESIKEPLKKKPTPKPVEPEPPKPTASEVLDKGVDQAVLDIVDEFKQKPAQSGPFTPEQLDAVLRKGWQWLKENPPTLEQVLAATGKTADQLRKQLVAPIANELTPAIRDKSGKLLVGERGKTHNDILEGIESPRERAMLIVEQPERGFVRNGEFISREEASKVLGESEPLQSERLREMQQEVGGAESKGIIAGSALEKWANEKLKGKLLSPTPEDMAALAVKGAAQLERGVTDFARWSKAMTDAHGPAIKPQLKQIYEQSKAIRAGAFNKPQIQPSSEQGAGTPSETLPITRESAAPEAPGRKSSSGSLDDIYRIFEPPEKTKTGVGQAVSKVAEAVRTGLSSKFRPLDKLAEDIAKAYGTVSKKGIAGIFEQLKGSRGRGEADIIRFDRDVSSLVKGSEKDFNAYMFLRRSLDRLEQDAATGEGRRKVAGYDIETLQAKLDTLTAQLGSEKLAKFRAAADLYQQHMDKALKLQVESGRMSQEVYDAIKSGNQFYAPFKVMKYIEETSRPEGTGKRVDTLADFTKAMKGIEDPNFRLGDMLGAARQSLLLSRILADKNNVMRKVADMAKDDTEGRFIRKLKGDQEAPHGWETVNVLEAGKPTKYATNPDVARALQAFGDAGSGIISKTLSLFSIPFRAGATALNLPFQISNLMADVPRQALVSKYGIGFNNFLRYPFDFAHALLSSVAGDVGGFPNKLFMDFLDSGVAGVTVQEHLTPKALRTETVSTARKVGEKVLWAIPDFASAIEQTSKVLGVKNAMKAHGVKSGAELAAKFPEAITELRRFSGSPDFGRQGMWTETARLNLLYMFFNARLQGTIADVGRLSGRDGAGTAAKTWFKVGTAVGLPTAYLYSLNNSEKYKDDYAQRPDQEKRNYWLIPKDTFITNEQGENMRDYWRIPKRESAKWVANLTESSLDFAKEKDPESFAKFSQNMLEDISPVNIQGDTFQERSESVAASLNPVLKAPLEAATGRDMFRHRDIVPDAQQKASPEQQYTDNTAEAFKSLADAMPDVAPEVFRSPLMLENMTKNLTAGLLTQFLKTKPVEGRSDAANQPLLRRFQAVPFTEQTEVRKEIEELQREGADAYLKRHRQAQKLVTDGKGKELAEILKGATDPKLIRHTVDLWLANKNGITNTERQVLALPVDQRAKFISKKLSGLNPEQKQALILNYAKKRILTEAVAAQIAEELQP